MIAILDFGGAHGQLVARQVRSHNVYCEVLSPRTTREQIEALGAKGIILVGDARDAAAGDAVHPRPELYEMGLPILALGYGARILCRDLGGKLQGATAFDGVYQIEPGESPLFDRVSGGRRVVERADAMEVPEGFIPSGDIDGAPAVFINAARKMYAMQFVPEQSDQDGIQILRNFALNLCGCQNTWTMENFVEEQVAAIRARVGDGRVLCAMSGGVDSSVCVTLVNRAVGNQLFCIYVNTGLMRKNESAEVEGLFRGMLGDNLICVDAEDRFLDRLRGVSDPEAKRKIVGEEFIRVFEEEARRIGRVDFLVQGTIYPDIIESGIGGEMIKSHHNVGGLPDAIDFKEILEPVRALFKDEVRAVGEVMGLPEALVWRQPFPGPGLSVRCLGEVTKQRLDVLREADFIFRDEIEKAGLARQIWQYFAVLTDIRSTGIKRRQGVGDMRSYEHTVALRAIHSKDAMVASAVHLPWDLIQRTVERITSQVEGVNRVVLDVTGKPPATIEWE